MPAGFRVSIAMRMKIYFRKGEGDPPKLLSPMDIEEGTSPST